MGWAGAVLSRNADRRREPVAHVDARADCAGHELTAGPTTVYLPTCQSGPVTVTTWRPMAGFSSAPPTSAGDSRQRIAVVQDWFGELQT